MADEGKTVLSSPMGKCRNEVKAKGANAASSAASPGAKAKRNISGIDPLRRRINFKIGNINAKIRTGKDTEDDDK